MSVYPPNGPQPSGRPDELGDLLAAGLERDLGTPVDTARLLDGVRTGEVRLRRRRRAYGATAAVLLVAGIPFGMARMTGLLGTQGLTPPAASFSPASTSPTPTVGQGEPSAPTDVPPEQYAGELRQLVGPAQPVNAAIEIPFEALVVPKDGNRDLARLLTVRTQPVELTQSIWDTVDQACDTQPGGLQWNLSSVRREYDEPASTKPGWQLKTVVRALTVSGAKSQLRYLQNNLARCTSKKLGGAGWTVQSPVPVGDNRVLATAEDGSSVIAIGVVRIGAATSGFWLRVPPSAGSAATRLQLATTNGNALLEAAAARLVDSDVPGLALSALDRLLQGPGPTSASPVVTGSPGPGEVTPTGTVSTAP